MVIGGGKKRYFFPAVCKSIHVSGTKPNLAAAFHVFLIDAKNRGTVKMYPSDGPEILGAFMVVFVFAVDKGAVAAGETVFFPEIGERTAAGEYHHKKVGGKPGMGADMRASGVYLADLLQIQKIFPGKFGRGVEYPVGGDVFTVVAGIFHVFLRFCIGADLLSELTFLPLSVYNKRADIYSLDMREFLKYNGTCNRKEALNGREDNI